MADNIARRFLIHFSTIDDLKCEHSVVTWMDSDKAIAVAAYEHAYDHAELLIYRVEVEDLGELDWNEGGYILNDDDVTDRMEW